MKVKYVQTFWGIEEFFKFNPGLWKDTFQRIVDQGYSAIEIAIDFLPPDSREFIVKTSQEKGLDIITQIHTCGYPIKSSNVQEHLNSLKESIQRAKLFNPSLINCHSGCDYWTFKQSKEFFTEAQKIEKEEGVHLSHETHRSRVLFTPWNTFDLLSEVNELKITADLSHWVLACERLFDHNHDPFWNETLNLLSKRTSLIHARVGTSQTPQILDVSLPEHKLEVETFENWWFRIFTESKENLKEALYVEPEYGPDPYMPKIPFTCEPMANIWKVRENSLKRLKKLFL